MKKDGELAISVSIKTIIVNIVLTLFKLVAAFVGHSGAMLSDAVHSASDVLSTIVVIVGVKVSKKAADADHPYGHERLECVAAITLAVMLGLTGIGIGISGVNAIFSSVEKELKIPGVLPLVAAVVSIAVKEAMYWYTRKAAKLVNSDALMADAWHHRSDALSSVGSFVGILGARLKFPILDPLASLFICVFILKAAFDIFRESISKMTDKSADSDTVLQIHQLITSVEAVKNIDKLSTRIFGSKLYVDVEISADANSSLIEAHDIAEKVHSAVETRFPKVKHCMVHVNPAS